MNFKKKLKRSFYRSRAAYLVAFLASLYFSMIVVKSVHEGTAGAAFPLFQQLNLGANALILKTYFFPISALWDALPIFNFYGSILDFYGVIAPPIIVFMISGFFIADHRHLRGKYRKLLDEIEREVALRELRAEGGIHELPKKAVVEIMINKATNDDPAWFATGWGQIAIGVSVTLIGAALGIAG